MPQRARRWQGDFVRAAAANSNASASEAGEGSVDTVLARPTPAQKAHAADWLARRVFRDAWRVETTAKSARAVSRVVAVIIIIISP